MDFLTDADVQKRCDEDGHLGSTGTGLSEKESKILDNDLRKRVFPPARTALAHIENRFWVKHPGVEMVGLLYRPGFSSRKFGKALNKKEKEKP